MTAQDERRDWWPCGAACSRPVSSVHAWNAMPKSIARPSAQTVGKPHLPPGPLCRIRFRPAILELYRLRWQIELAIKRMKSILGLGHLPKRIPPAHALGYTENSLSVYWWSAWWKRLIHFPPGAMDRRLRRSRWRETEFMLREMCSAISPPHRLATTLRDWEQIVFRLAEPSQGADAATLIIKLTLMGGAPLNR